MTGLGFPLQIGVRILEQISRKTQRELRQLVRKAEGFLQLANIKAIDSNMKREINLASEHIAKARHIIDA